MTRIPQQPRSADTPSPGFYRCSIVPRGPKVPCRIIEQDGWWLVIRNGEATSAAMREPWKVPGMEWTNMSEQIAEETYYALLANPPALDPSKPVDFRSVRTLMKEE